MFKHLYTLSKYMYVEANVPCFHVVGITHLFTESARLWDTAHGVARRRKSRLQEWCMRIMEGHEGAVQILY